MKATRHDNVSGGSPRISPISPTVIDQLEQLFASSSAQAYRDTLVEVYHTYIMHEHEHFPVHFDAMAANMYALIEFLRMADTEMSGRRDVLDDAS